MKRIAVLALVLATAWGPLRAQTTAEVAARDAEIRKNADKFELFPIQYDAEGKAVFRFIDPSKTFFFYEGKRYFGFRFRTPAVVEGDFAWICLLRSPVRPTNVGVLLWYILRRNGEMRGFSHYQDRGVNMYPKLKEKFPYTRDVTFQQLDKGAFRPNEEYVIWFSTLEGENPVEFALAFAFVPEGKDMRSRLPVGPTFAEMQGPQREDKDLKSYEGDPW